MIWTLKKIVALFLAKLLWFCLSDDDTACLSSQVQFFLCGKMVEVLDFMMIRLLEGTSCSCLNIINKRKLMFSLLSNFLNSMIMGNYSILAWSEINFLIRAPTGDQV